MSNQLELRHCRYFLAVAEELHFRKAAEKLFISQPGLSRQIKQMEEYLDVQLFERNNRNVILTPAGAYLKQEFKTLLQGIENSISHSKLLNSGVEGHIKVGYVGSAMHNVLPELLIAINKEYPNIHFTLEELNNYKQIDALVNQDLDIGFIRLNQVPRTLNVQSIWKETFSLVLPKRHKLTKKSFENLGQLKAEPFIFFERSYSPAYHSKVMSIFEDSGFSPIISHRTVHANTIFKLVENNFGAAIIPTSLQTGYDLKVKFIELKNIPQRTTLFMSWKKDNNNPTLQKFLNLAKAIST